MAATTPLVAVEEARTAEDGVRFYKAVVGFYRAAFGAAGMGREMCPRTKAHQEHPFLPPPDPDFDGVLLYVFDTPLVNSEGAAAGIVFTLESEDVASAVAKAVKAGAVAEGEITEVEGVGKVAKLKDPYGNLWTLSSRSEVSVPAPVADAPAA